MDSLCILTRQICKKLRVTPKTVRSWETEGYLVRAGTTPGRKERMYTRASVNAMVERMTRTFVSAAGVPSVAQRI